MIGWGVVSTYANTLVYTEPHEEDIPAVWIC